MVQILPTYDLGAQFGQGIGSVLGQLGQRQAELGQSERLKQALSGLSPEQAENPLELFSALSQYPEIASRIGELQEKKRATEAKRRIAGNIGKSLIQAGYPEETAMLWQNQFEAAPTGGQTDVIKAVDDLLKRAPQGKGMGIPQVEQPAIKKIDIPGIEEGEFNLNFPELKESKNLTPTESAKLKQQREKVNTPVYTETVDLLNGLEEDFRDIKTLQDLNQSGQLPVGLQKWNVNWETGDLRVPALANPESQLYVKTIARMLGEAKTFFPGRVTNFDLAQFKRRFPTLANSPEGRDLISKQLELANRIAYLREETLKESIDHYGADANPTEIRKYATENYRRLKGVLEGKLRDLNASSEKMYQNQKKQKNIERKKVTIGTKITPQIVDSYLEISGNDVQEAKRLAKEDGYEF